MTYTYIRALATQRPTMAVESTMELSPYNHANRHFKFHNHSQVEDTT